MTKFEVPLSDLQLCMEIIHSRIQRVDLDVTKSYIQVKQVRGIDTKTYVGKFVRVYCMGSGDGMTVHIEFDDNGRCTRVDEEMWGSLRGNELSYFIEADTK